MPFIAKLLAPLASVPVIVPSAVDDAAAGGSILFVAPSEFVLAGGFVSALERHDRSPVWVRLGPEDRDPGTFLLSLIGSVERLRPGFGKATVELMRRQPGPVAGWVSLFGCLADELAGALGPSGAIVLEGVHHLEGSHPTLRLLGAHLLRSCQDEPGWFLISDTDVPGALLPAGIRRRSAHDLHVSGDDALHLLEREVSGLDARCAHRAVALCDGQAVLLGAVCATGGSLGAAVVEQATSTVSEPAQLLGFLARAWLETVDLDAQRALALTLRLEYSHPALTGAALGRDLLPPGPWLEALEGGWSRIRASWRAPLRWALPDRAMPDREMVHRAAGHLLSHGGDESAIPLYLELDDWSCALRAIGASAERLMDLGQWETLREWLDQMPETAIKEQPWLIYDRAEIAVAGGSIECAWRDFSTATICFTERDDPAGACQSMLAESVVATGQRDFARAQARALAAHALAASAGLVWHQVWASWQLGSLAWVAGELDSALAYFGEAASVAARIGDPRMTDLVRRAEQVTERLRELDLQRELHRQALVTLERAVQEAAERLGNLLSSPPGDLEDLVGAYGWLHTPMMLKLPPPTPLRSDADLAGGPRFWSKALRALGLRREYVHDGVQVPPDGLRPLTGSAAGQAAGQAVGQLGPVASTRVQALEPSWPGEVRGGVLLTVHLFGQMRVMLAGVPVGNWSSGPSRRVLKYLLTHRDPWATQEMMTDVFWPGSTPEAARNNLRVAVHRLRRSLQEITDTQVIVFRDDTYRLHPDVRLWLDVDEFERYVESGRQLDAVGELAGATTAYELAAAVYQGDFMADDPYEEWAVHTREQLRLTCLDTLDRLSHLYFSQGRCPAAVPALRRGAAHRAGGRPVTGHQRAQRADPPPGAGVAPGLISRPAATIVLTRLGKAGLRESGPAQSSGPRVAAARDSAAARDRQKERMVRSCPWTFLRR